MAEPTSARLHAIPVLYTCGTHYEVGVHMGRTFSGIIKEYLSVNAFLNQLLLPAYGLAEGKKFYEETLATVKASFPQYVRELEGVAEGAQVEFFKLFLLHVGSTMYQFLKMTGAGASLPLVPDLTSFSTSIVLNHYYNRLIAHTADEELVNYMYLVIAHIIEAEPQGKYKVTEERFMSLCMAGHLPGFTVSSNYDGLVFAVDRCTARTIGIGKTPPHFLARALLSAENMEQVAVILTDQGVGSANSFSVSVALVNDRQKKCFNIEVAPAIVGETQSVLNIAEVERGSFDAHLNSFKRIQIEQNVDELTALALNTRKLKLESFPQPKTKEDVLSMMSSESIFQETITVAVLVFDLTEKTMAVYRDRPTEAEPTFQIPLILKTNCRIYEF